MKKISRRSFLTVCGAAAAAAALTACGGSASSASGTAASASTTASSAAGQATGTLSGNVATGGSTSMKNVIAALTEALPRLSRASPSATTPPVPAQASPALPTRRWTSACPPAP